MYKMLKALLTIAPKNDVRYYMNGIHVTNEKGIVKLQATDGHVGLQLDIESDTFNVVIGTDIILDGFTLSIVMKMFNAKTKMTFNISSDVATLNGVDITLIDGRYPDLERAFKIGKGSKPADEIGLDFKILDKMCKACSMLSNNGKFEIRDSYSPLFITSTFNKVDKLTSCVMPCRL